MFHRLLGSNLSDDHNVTQLKALLEINAIVSIVPVEADFTISLLFYLELKSHISINFYYFQVGNQRRELRLKRGNL